MTDDPLDAMKARWSYIQGFLFPWMREDNDPITEALGRVVTTLDVIGLEAFVPEPPRGPGRPPEDRRALARAFVAKAVLGVPTTSALIERLDVDKSLRRILGWERRSSTLRDRLVRADRPPLSSPNAMLVHWTRVTEVKFRIDLPMDGFPSDGVSTTTILAR